MTWEGWTEANVTLLRKLDAEGLSCSQTAKRLGAPSRNAVIAKRHRIGLSQPLSVEKAKRADAVRGRARPVLKTAGNGMVFEACPPGIEVTVLPEQSGGLTIIDPGFSGCKWPIGGAGASMRFCCVPTEGATYCADHKRRAYQVPPPGKKSDAKELIRSLRRYA